MDPFSLTLGLLAGCFLALAVAALALRGRIARLRAAEERARRKERLAELGALTGGLAHEIKNPLSTIGLNVQLAAEAIQDSPLPDDERATLVRRVETVAREATRLANILNDFLRFAGRVKLEPADTDLAEIVTDLVDFYRPQADLAKVVIRVDAPAHPIVARVDGALVKQAVLNLLINATQAMVAAASPTRELLVRLASPAEPPRGARHATPPAVAIHVIDTGPGIPADRHPEIFRPYVSGRKGGSGLGLAVTRRIVEEHGGRIELHSEPGRGSDFIVVLPVAGPAAERPEGDDDRARRTLLDRLLRRAERHDAA
jgi:signal transduction histidine kinase